MEISVVIETVYGKQKVYPACEKSKLFAALTGCITLTKNAIEKIKALGYTVNVQSTVPATL